ncbi:CPXCG motif-containing cysteine-rich protein [Microbulbifer sp. CnH-101-G]|uniref:CPXCG motif-containing cysteine-rich protein n=1 Tax=Microbulbifer sp. CnH-101-G TaxID=3243393 RepID=UPI004039AFB5
MNPIIEETIQCPYCGEYFSTLVDTTMLPQEYTEDCQVCCRPIIFQVTSGLDASVSVNVYREDETF